MPTLGRHVADVETPYEAVCVLARAGRPFTSDDVIEMVGVPDEEHAPNSRNSAIGAAFAHASREGKIVPTSKVTKSSQPSRKGGMVREWVGARWR